jgi:peptidoglycan/LPS O-acetylase OafA/YrhL
VVVVALVAAVMSYSHMQALAERAGEGWRSYLLPLAVDGLILAASMTMLVRHRMCKPAGALAWCSMLAGIVASLAANVAAAEPTLIGRLVAAVPPVALLLASELLMRQIRNARGE